MIVNQNMKYHRYQSSFSVKKNEDLERHYVDLKDQESTYRTHFFEGRYENIYIDREKVPDLSLVLKEALKLASKILNSSMPLKVGFWFNEMHFGDQTISHTHDEDDELLSGVYYISVPKKSGDLVLGNPAIGDIITIAPKTGDFIFFTPDLMHGVKRSYSHEMRLSIGMNFGPA